MNTNPDFTIEITPENRLLDLYRNPQCNSPSQGAKTIIPVVKLGEEMTYAPWKEIDCPTVEKV
jgi:hypothetical protein